MATQTYFLGSNSASGFYSAYHHFCPPENGTFLWVIKGGPGCGKSSFMRHIGKAAEDAGLDVEYVICSGDPDSLDGVYIPEKKVGYVDGTAPHVTEVAFPGANGLYLDLGQFYDKEALIQKAAMIRDCNLSYKAVYKEAYAVLSALPRLTAPSPIPDTIHARFHTAVSCKGIVSVMPSARQIKTSQGKLNEYLVSAQKDDIVYLHPLWPDIAMGFFSQKDDTLYCSDAPMPDCDPAISLLEKAKSLHDELESIYNPHVDFDGVYALAKEHSANYM